jgi:hypothetical protein
MKDEVQLTGREGDLNGRLCEEFDSALHAMAQPLTVLRGALGALKLRGSLAVDADRYVDLSNIQVDRICVLMSGMRTLLDDFQFDAVCAPTNLGELIAAIVEKEDFSLQRSGLRISVAKADHELRVIADPVRTEHAMRAVLSAVAAASSQDGEIHLTLDPRDGFADVTVHAPLADEKKLTSADRLGLSIAEASIRSQHGFFECFAEPLRISLKLPLHDHEEQQTELADFSTLVEQVELGRSLGLKNALVSQASDW